jgi:acetyl esterase
MTIDNDTRQFLDKLNATTPPPPGSTPLKEFRAALDAFKPIGWDREELAEVRDLLIPVPGHSDVPVRLYRPEGDLPMPLLLCVHGGSWVRLSVEQQDEYYRALANRCGCVLGAVEYTLAPEAQLPQAIEEILAVAANLWPRGDELGFDSGRIGVLGESSGGNLVGAALQLARDRGEVEFDCQVMLLPMLAARFDSPSWKEYGDGYGLRQDSLEWALEQYAPGVSRTDPRLSPLLAEDFSGLPPALIVTAEADPLRDDGQLYAAALERAGVPTRHWRVDGLIHHAPMVPKEIPSAQVFLDEFGTAIAAAFDGVPQRP